MVAVNQLTRHWQPQVTWTSRRVTFVCSAHVTHCSYLDAALIAVGRRCQLIRTCFVAGGPKNLRCARGLTLTFRHILMRVILLAVVFLSSFSEI